MPRTTSVRQFTEQRPKDHAHFNIKTVHSHYTITSITKYNHINRNHSFLSESSCVRPNNLFM